MRRDDFTDEMNDKSLPADELEKELAAFRKKERRKMLFVGFLAGLMVAVGAAMYISEANADTDLYGYRSFRSGAYDASYAGNSSQGAGGAGNAGGGCCGGGGASLGNVSLSDLEKQALEQYGQEKGSSQDVKAKAADYGCHIQIDIKDKTGKVIRSYGYQGGQLYVIS